MSRNGKRKINVEAEKKRLEAFFDKIQRPGECNKLMTVVLDRKVLSGVHGTKILEKLNDLEMKTDEKDLEIPFSIKWIRTIKQRIVTDDGELIEFSDKLQEENYLMILMLAVDFVAHVKSNTLLDQMQKARLDNEDKQITLVVFGLKEYCRHHQGSVGIKQTEIKLTQIQFLANVTYRMHENPEDLALTIAQFSKAIAEEPFKQKQNAKIDQEQFYLASENKSNENVQVRDSDGLGRFWQLQLMKLPLVTWDVSQSITRIYPMPKKLIEAYENSSNPQNLLADIPVIRTGPLSKKRRIGPELSRKIYTLMTSQNPDDII